MKVLLIEIGKRLDYNTYLDSLKPESKLVQVDYTGAIIDKFNLSNDEAEQIVHDWVCEKMINIPFGTKGCG